MAQTVLTIVGAYVGSFFGPAGTTYGAQIGAAIGPAVGPTVELSGQDALLQAWEPLELPAFKFDAKDDA